MSERLLPWCQACRDRVRPSVSQSKRNPGAVYYSCTLCPPRNNYFRWASDLWSCMYRTWLDKQRIRCIDEHDNEQWIPVSDSVVPDVVDQAHTVFESTVLMGTPQVRRPVSKHMFLFTICTCVMPVESSAVPSVSVFKYLDALDYDYSDWIAIFCLSLSLLWGLYRVAPQLLVQVRKFCSSVGHTMRESCSAAIRDPNQGASQFRLLIAVLVLLLTVFGEFHGELLVATVCGYAVVAYFAVRGHRRLCLLILGLMAMAPTAATTINRTLMTKPMGAKGTNFNSSPSLNGPVPDLQTGSSHLRGASFRGAEPKLPCPVKISINPCHSMMGSVNIDGHDIQQAMPDTGSNYNVFPNNRYLYKTAGRLDVAVEGVSDARATEYGSGRISQLDRQQELVTSDLPQSVVIPTCGTVLIGNRNKNLVFDSWNSQLVSLINGNRDDPQHYIPVTFIDGTYSVPTYVHQRGVNHTDDQIRGLLLQAARLPDSKGARASQSKGASVHSNDASFSYSKGAPGQSSNSHLPIVEESNFSVVDLCCGIGAVTDAAISRGYSVLAASDIDPLAAQQYEHRYGEDIRLYGSISPELRRNGTASLSTVAQDADVCVIGSPCNDFSNLNMHADLKTATSDVIKSGVEFAAKTRPKTMLWENVQNFYLAQNGHVFKDLVDEFTRLDYTVQPFIENSSDWGSCQSRDRLWSLMIRNDVAQECGNFLRTIPADAQPPPMRNFLDPVEGLEVRLDQRVFVDRPDVVPSRHGTAIFAHTGKSGPRNAAYSIDFLCPTINSGDVTIYDDRIGVYRRLNLSERSRIQGFKEFKFSNLVPLAKHAGFLGRSMDLSSVDSWLVNIKEYLHPFKPHCCLSNSERHKGCGHPGREVSAVMGLPYPKHCVLCEQGNCTKASGSSGVMPRVTQYGHTQHLDFKISATPGDENVTVLMGATDDATNFQEIYPMTRRSEVLHVMRQLKADIQHRGGVLKHIHTDNDSVFTSQAFNEFLLEDPQQLLTMSLCPPHHHEYNGRQESRWRMAKPIATKAMAQLGLVLGDKALKYWDYAYIHAKDVLNRRHFKRHGSSDYEVSPYQQVFNKEPNLDLLFPFGALCSVHDHYSDAHAIVGRKGVILGKCYRHSDICHKVLMLDTNRIIDSMDVKLTAEDGQQELTFVEADRLDKATTISQFVLPDSVDPSCDSSSAEHALAQNSNDELVAHSSVPDSSVEPMDAGVFAKPKLPITGKKLFGSDKSKSSTTATVKKPSTKYTAASFVDLMDCIVRLNEHGFSKSKSPYIRNRCHTVSDLKVCDALRCTVTNSTGDDVLYGASDLAYDLNTSKLSLATNPLADCHAMFQHNPPSTVFTSDNNWLNKLPDVGRAEIPMFDHHGVMPDSWFDERSQRYLRFWSDVAPVGFMANHNIEIEWGENDTEVYTFVHDPAPHGFASALDLEDVKTPRSIRDVHRLPRPQRLSILKSLQKEYNGLWGRGMFKLVKPSSLPRDQPVFPTTPVFKFKYHADGSFDCAKSRVCVRGDLMIPERDFGEVHSPTSQLQSVKLIISECPSQGKIACTYDIRQAFTYGKCDPLRPTYIKQFPGTEKILDEDTGDELVMKLMYRLYGDPAAPRAFHKELHEAYMDFRCDDLRFSQSKADPCVYYLRCTGDNCDDKSLLTSVIFVDDSANTFVPGSDAERVYVEFIKFLKTRFDLKDDSDGMDLISSFLGMNFTWADDRSWVRIDQPHAIDKMVTRAGASVTERPHFTPLPPGTEVMLDDCPDVSTKEGMIEAANMAKLPFRGRLGELLWLSRVSRPDISGAVARLSSVANNPGFVHWDLTTYLINYVHHTRHLGIVYRRDRGDYPMGFVDVAFSPNYGNDDDNFRSFEAAVFKNAGAPIAWFARFQKNLAMSSTESEYLGLTTAAKQIVQLTTLCEELGIHSDEPFLLYEDNKAAIKMSENAANSKRTIHMDRRAHFIRSQVNEGNIQLAHCPSKFMEADLATKMMPRPGFEDLRARMGLTYEHCATLEPYLDGSRRSG